MDDFEQAHCDALREDMETAYMEAARLRKENERLGGEIKRGEEHEERLRAEVKRLAGELYISELDL